jgi:hypothetical protein
MVPPPPVLAAASPNSATTNSRSEASAWCTHASMSFTYR